MERRLVTLRGVGAALASQLIVAACGGGGGDDGGITNPPPPPPPAAVASVAVTVAPTTINVGQTAQATAVLRDAQNNVLTGRTVTWESSNTGLASISPTTGVITGVGAGTATITASSENRSGQAQITVNLGQTAPPPQISGLTITQNGQAVNLQNVAGNLTLNFNVDVPAGFSGQLIVRVDTIEFVRKPITAPLMATSDGAVVAAPIVVGADAIVETAKTTTIVSADEIRESGVLRNLDHILSITVQPNAPGAQSATQQVNIRTNNPVHAHGLYGFSGQTTLGPDGKTYTGDDGTGAVVFATYGNEVINGFEVILTDQQSLYGHDPVAGVVNVIQRITRTDTKKFTIPEALVERPNLTYVLDKVTINGITIDPQVDYLGNAQFTTDLVGSGFANTPQQVQGRVPPAGLGYLQLSSHLVEQLPGTVKGQWTIDPFHLDNVGPQPAAPATGPVFSLLDRMTTVGGAARWADYGFGANNSQLSARYDFAGGLRYDRLTDFAGIDQTKTEFFAATISVNNVQNLFTPQFKVGPTLSLNESSGTRPYTAGARVYDLRGNYADYFLRTSPKNPWNSLGVQSTGSGLGTDAASFGFTQTRANLNLTAMPTETVWNNSTIDPSLCWFWNVSGAVDGVPDGWLSVRARLNGVYGYGAGTSLDKYQIIPSTGGASSGTSTFFTGSAVQQIFSRLGGTSAQGLYEFEFKAASNSGLYIGDSNYPKTYKFLYDYIPPANAGITYTGTVTAGQPGTATLTGTDNYGLKSGRVGIRFNYPSSLFFGGKVYVPIGEIPIPPAQGGAPNKNLSMPLMGTPPIGFSFFDPFSGAIDGAFYRSDGGSWQLKDMAGNLGTTAFATFANTAPQPTLPNTSSVKASISSTNWCPGTCSGGGQNIVDLIFNFLDPRASGVPDLSKAEWYGIPSSGGGVVYPLGKASTLTSVVEGTGRRLSYNLQFDAKTYCGPPGPMQVFVIGYNPGYYLKVNPFFQVNVQTPVRYSNDCLKLSF